MKRVLKDVLEVRILFRHTCGRANNMHSMSKKGAMAANRTVHTSIDGRSKPTMKQAVLAVIVSFLVFGGLASLILDWVAAIAMGIFMGVFVGILATEGGE